MTANSNRPTLRRGDMVLFTVSAILLLETLTATASIGPAAITWWVLLAVVFMLPYALICAEMGTTFPERGGIYAWVRAGFGPHWAARASWGYWVNTAVWLPAIYILFAGIFTELFMPDLSLATQLGIGIGLTWISVALIVVTLDVGKWVANLGALVKMGVFAALIVGAILHALQGSFANPLTLASLAPDWSSSLSYIPAIVYGMLGFELVSASSDEMRDPARDVPRAILTSGIIILLLYIAATTAVLAALPADDIDLVDGLVATLRVLFGDSPSGQTIVVLLGIGALYTFFTNGVTWAIGCNRAAAEAARAGELPPAFGRESARGTPAGAALIMGCVSTAILLLYAFLVDTRADLFWSLFAFSAVIFLLPYIGLVLAFVQTRIKVPNRPRPFRIPGGMLVARLCAYACFTCLVLSVVLFVWTPGAGIDHPVLWGALVTLVIGEGLIRISLRKTQG